jgi:Glycosyl transferase family 2
MTLLVRDEVDIVESNLAFHLNAGVDFVIATDHGSTDGTTEILESYARSGRLLLLRRRAAEQVRQREWVTSMARLAASDYDADWVINSDADEFWWPRGGSLKDMLRAVAPEYGVVHALIRGFVPRPEDDRFFADRLIWRYATHAPVHHPVTPFRPARHVVHRGDPGVVVGQGSHRVYGVRGAVLDGWYPIEVLHFPLRTRLQSIRKHANAWNAWRRGDLALARAFAEEGRAGEFFDRVLADDAALARGLEEGTIVEDTRLRDALGSIRRGPGASFPKPEVTQEAALAVDAACLVEANVVRLQRRVDEIEARATTLERGPSNRRGPPRRSTTRMVSRDTPVHARSRRTVPPAPARSPRVVLTLLVRDEADVVDAHLKFHLDRGVDLAIVTDHRSDDGTTEILESYVREGYVRLFVERAERIRQPEWVTRMARLAATEYQADWVINSDADEFWWPHAGSLKKALAAVSDDVGLVRPVQRPFVPRPDDGGGFEERMTVRLAVDAPINDPSTPYRPVVKAIHRGHPRVVVGQGNHSVAGVPGARLDWWPQIELFHLPLRSRAQVARKHENTWRAWHPNLRGDLARARLAAEDGRPWGFYDRVVVDDEALRRGLAEGILVEDTRLCDALRALKAAAGTAAVPEPRAAPSSPAAERMAHAVEAACFVEAEVVRLQRWADGLTERVGAREHRRVWKARYPSARR